MEFSFGMIIVLVAMLIFYLRISMLRGQKKRFEREYALKRRRVNGRSKGAALPQRNPGTPPFQIKSWWLVGLAILLMLIGLGLYTKFVLWGTALFTSKIIDTYHDFWYIPVALGVIIFAFCFKIQKPILDD